jgi:hypothetical protein
MNGYDFDPPETYHFNPVFTITHAGTFYGNRKPGNFFQALSELLAEKKITNIRINLVGAGNTILPPSELQPYLQVTGKIDHEEALRFTMESDANLIIKPATEKGAIPGKLFEYLGTLKPILACMDSGEETASIIRRANAGFIAGFDDIGGIKGIILEAYALWAGRRRLEVDRDYIAQFQRRNQVKLLEEEILKQVR